MSRVVVVTYVTLDGVMEDPSWTAPFWNHELATAQREQLFNSDALLLGRVTYEGFSSAWPTMTDDQGFAARMNSLPKHVASTTLSHGEWNAHIIDGDVPAAVAELKRQDGADLLVYGSGDLVHTLGQHGLVDEYHLMVFPLVLGSGRRLFRDGIETTTLELVGSTVTAKGVALLSYAPTSVVTDP